MKKNSTSARSGTVKMQAYKARKCLTLCTQPSDRNSPPLWHFAGFKDKIIPQLKEQYFLPQQPKGIINKVNIFLKAKDFDFIWNMEMMHPSSIPLPIRSHFHKNVSVFSVHSQHHLWISFQNFWPVTYYGMPDNSSIQQRWTQLTTTSNNCINVTMCSYQLHFYVNCFFATPRLVNIVLSMNRNE